MGVPRFTEEHVLVLVDQLHELLPLSRAQLFPLGHLGRPVSLVAFFGETEQSTSQHSISLIGSHGKLGQAPSSRLSESILNLSYLLQYFIRPVPSGQKRTLCCGDWRTNTLSPRWKSHCWAPLLGPTCVPAPGATGGHPVRHVSHVIHQGSMGCNISSVCLPGRTSGPTHMQFLLRPWCPVERLGGT